MKPQELSDACYLPPYPLPSFSIRQLGRVKTSETQPPVAMPQHAPPAASDGLTPGGWGRVVVWGGREGARLTACPPGLPGPPRQGRATGSGAASYQDGTGREYFA